MNEQDVLLDTLRRKKISIQIDKDGLLEIEAPQGTLTEDIITQIREKREALLNYLKGLSGQNSRGNIPAAPPASSYPLSSSQLRLWVLNQIDHHSTAYNIPCSVMLDGDFSRDKLSRAITAVVNRHEILRTVFREDASGAVRQWVLPETKLNVEFTDLSHAADQDEQAKIWMEEDKKTPFDLSKGPLFRVALFRMAAGKYLLYFNMHHIISDGWSINVLAEDVLNYYNAFEEGRTPGLQPLAIQYKDYAVWQQEQLATADFEQHRLYWMKQFEGPLPLLNLPADHVRPAVFTHHGSAVATIISNELIAPLQELCQQHGATLFMGLLTITNALFYRYTGQQDIITGSPVVGREQAELANQIGVYVNTLPFRIRVDGDKSVGALLKEVRNITSAAYEHQAYPFDKIVDDLAVKRDMSRSALFDVMISLHNLQDKRVVENVHAIPENEIITLGKEVVKFDMSIDFMEMAEGLYMKVAYNEDIYQQTMVHRLISHFKGMLSRITEHRETPVNHLPYLSDSDKDRLLLTFNDTTSTYPRDVTITGLFNRQVELNPGNIAVAFENETITYEALQEKVHSLAALLTAGDVNPGDFVPLLMSRGIDYVVAFMALLQLGAICTPVSINWPGERVETLLKELHPKVVLANEEGISRCGIQRPAQLLVISHHQLKPGKTFFENRENPEGPVCMFYTSGTTGLPKGVVVMHRGIMNRFLWMNDYFGAAAAQSVLRTTRHIFDSALWQLFWPLINGGRTVIPSEHRPLDLEYFAALIRDYQVTMTDFVPSLFNEVVNELRQKQHEYHFDSLKDIVIGGEAIHVLSANIFRQHYPHIRLTNLYGPTEASIGCIFYELKKDHYDKIPIGKPIHNVRIYLVDEKGQLVPEGIGGEICIAGVCLAAGYYRDENRTSEKFIENPFATAAYSRMYRTGDIGKWLPDGNIEYLGRIDEQVKIRGYRIEPGEIEHALTAVPGITAAAVIPWKAAEGQTCLVGYVTASHAIHKQALKQALRKQLPEYMVPVHFVQLDHLPLLPNGKINKKVLPVPSVADLETGVELIAPRNPVEEALVAAYQEVTRRSTVSIKDSFFDLGGDSIKAILLASQLRQRGYTVKVGDVLMYPVLEELATQVQLQHGHLPEQSAVEGAVVLTPIQHWFLERSYAHKHHYNQSVLLSSRIAVNSVSLEQSLAQLVAHHDALRMVYRKEDDSYQQYNRGLEDAGYHLEEHDLTQVTDGLTQMEELCESLQRSIDLSQGPLLKAGLFHLNTGDRLLLVIHHLVVDGVSWRILLEDLSTLYQQLSDGKPAQLPQKSDSFRDWAAHQQQQAGSHLLEAEWAYWSSLTAGSGTPLQPDMPAGAHQIGSSATEGFILEEHATRQLLTKAHRAYHTDINDVLLTCLLQAVQDVFEQPHLLLTMEGHGREDIGGNVNISRTVGWFTSMYPVLLESKAGEAAEHTLVRVKDQLRRVPRKGIGYGMLRYLHASGEERLGGLRQSDITFNYLGDFGSGVSAGDGAQIFDYGTAAKGHETDASYEPESKLSVTGLLLSGQLHISVRYGTAQYHGETIRELCDRYAAHLTAIITLLSSKDTVQLTAGDLTYKELDMDRLQALNTTGDISDVYTLSPLQEGLYYHWLSGASRSMYVEQKCYRLRGSFNMDVLRQSYAYLVNRHAILRTSFHHAHSKQTIQAVHQYMAPDFRHQQLEAAVVQAYKKADCEEGFDLHRGPCMRLTVLELNADEYEFIWTHHHILMDGWCGSVVLQEFFAIYRSLLQNSIPVLAPVSPYVNYIRWLAAQDQEGSRSYWASYLAGYEQIATLPFREAEGDEYVTGEDLLMFSAEEAAQITRYCRHTGITENTFIQGAWSYLLTRYNNTEDVVFGAVVSGRPAALEGVENMIGLFINTIPVRARYNGQMTVKTLLQQLHQDAVNSLPHHYVKLSDIQSRSIPGNRLFDHILIHENFPVWEIAEGKEAGGKGLEELELLSSDAVAGTNYPFNVVVITRDHQLKIKFNYNKNLYSDAAVHCIGKQLKSIISIFSGPDDKTLQEIAGLTTAEEEQVLKTFNNTAVDYANTKTIVTAFKERVQAHPEATALVFEDRVLTYRDLDERSNRLSRYLLSRGVGKEQPVAICMNRSTELIIGILGILKSGGAYVPIDPSYPAERIAYIATDSGAGIILTWEELLPSFAGITDKQVVLIDRDWNNIAACSGQEVIVDISAASLAYVIYTSGSTGKPKGVMIEHTAMINLIEWHIKRYEVTPLCRSTTMAGVGFDACSLEMWSALLSGSSLYIIGNELRLRPELLLQFYHQHGITHAFVPPALIPDMAAAPQPEGLLLKYILIGGDRLPYVDVSKLSFTLVNQYGPTESTVMVTDYPISKHNRKAPPIGKPIANTQLYILGDRQQLVPVGTVGEICIGGVQLARGYLNNPLLTAEKFIPNPYHPGERIYRTGDMGRWLPDGNIECLGRLDDQLKVRGHRIEAGEIEHALTRLEGIDAAVALVHNGHANRQLLVAFFTGDNNDAAAPLRQQLQALLPEYMIPARLIKLDRFPLTPNGKIDKKALVLLPVEDGQSAATYIPPRNKAEADLTAIIAGVLEMPAAAVGIRENFFDMGANSLDLVRMAGEISRQFGKELKVTQLFTYPNIQELSDYLFSSHEPDLLPAYENIEQDLDDILTVFEE